MREEKRSLEVGFLGHFALCLKIAPSTKSGFLTLSLAKSDRLLGSGDKSNSNSRLKV